MVEITAIIFILVSLILIALSYLVGMKIGSLKRDRYWESEIPSHRKDAVLKSRAVLSGHFSEQLAPYLPDFPFKPTECKFIGKPFDFLVFKGMDEKKINEVVFVEIKSGKAKLSGQEKSLKEIIEKGRVRWEEYRVPEELTRRDNQEEDLF